MDLIISFDVSLNYLIWTTSYSLVEEGTIENLDIADSNAVSASSSTNVQYNNVNGAYIEGTSVWIKCTARTGEQL